MKFPWLRIALLAWPLCFMALLRGPKPSSAIAEEDEPGAIEVGAVEGELRYWRAKEGLRKGESRLSSQAAVRTSMEARATALTGWASVALLAVAGAWFSAKGMPARGGLGSAALVLFAAAGIGVHTARPSVWSLVGYDPSVITTDRNETELEVIESVAVGISKGIQENNLRLDRMANVCAKLGDCLPHLQSLD